MVVRFVRDEEAAGSNPVIPTIDKITADAVFLLLVNTMIKDVLSISNTDICLTHLFNPLLDINKYVL